MRDYYEILGLDPDAHIREIKEAYRELAQINHPDRHVTSPPGVKTRAERTFKRINEAYETLSDPERRAAYDASRSSAGSLPKKPEFAISPDDVRLDDVDPTGGPITFSAELVQIGGPPFDPSIHKLRLTKHPPWNDKGLDVTLKVSGPGEPISLVFELDPSDLPYGLELTGPVSIQVNVVL